MKSFKPTIFSGYQADTDAKRPNLTSLSQRKYQQSESLTEKINDGYNYENEDQTIDNERNDHDDENDYSHAKNEVTSNPKSDPKNIDHENAGSLDSSLSETVPVFKNTEKMYVVNVKPAGGFIKFKCQAIGIFLYNLSKL